MNDKILNTWNEQIEKLGAGFGPARDAAKLGVDHLEKLVALQLDAAQSYAELAVKEARAALDVNDTESLQAYLKRQQELGNTIGTRVKGDAEKVVSLNKAFVDQIQKIAKQNVPAAAPKAAKAAK